MRDALVILAAAAGVGIIAWQLTRRPASSSASSSSSASWLAGSGSPDRSFVSLGHPADAYAGTWTAEGPLIPSRYDKQIWD